MRTLHDEILALFARKVPVAAMGPAYIRDAVRVRRGWSRFYCRFSPSHLFLALLLR